MELIANIIKILDKKNISIYKLCKETEISQTTFHNWKNGTQPTADKIYKILNYLEVSPNELFGYTGTENDRLTENEKEMLDLFQQLPDREQIKEIGRLEGKLENRKTMGKSSDSIESA